MKFGFNAQMRLGARPKEGLSARIAGLPGIFARFDLSELSSVFLQSDGTGGAPSIGGGVGRVLDLSGNDRHMIQAAPAERPTYQAGGVMRFDGIVQNMPLPFPSGAGPSNLTLVCMVKTLDPQGMLANDGSESPFMGAWDSDLAASTISGRFGGTVEIDGDAQYTDRASLSGAVATGSWVLFVIRNVDLMTIDKIVLSGFADDNRIDGDIGPRLLCLPDAIYAAHQALIHRYVMSGLA